MYKFEIKIVSSTNRQISSYSIVSQTLGDARESAIILMELDNGASFEIADCGFFEEMERPPTINKTNNNKS